jgi:hypothetical protein
MEIKLCHFIFRYRSVDHFIDVFRSYYGPVHKAFLALDEPGQQALDVELRAIAEKFNTGHNGEMRVPGEYAEVVITKR